METLVEHHVVNRNCKTRVNASGRTHNWRIEDVCYTIWNSSREENTYYWVKSVSRRSSFWQITESKQLTESQIVSLCICSQWQSDNHQRITLLLTTADFNAFHVLNNCQLAQIKDASYENTLQKCEYCPVFWGGYIKYEDTYRKRKEFALHPSVVSLN